MMCRQEHPIEGGKYKISRMEYQDGYVFWLEHKEYKRRFKKRDDVSMLEIMDIVARKYRMYINGLILSDPLLEKVHTTRLHRR